MGRRLARNAERASAGRTGNGPNGRYATGLLDLLHSAHIAHFPAGYRCSDTLRHGDCHEGCRHDGHRRYPVSQLLARKTIEQSIADTEEPTHSLRKRLGALDLTVFGVGVVIGTGIFVLTGEAAATSAGPAVAISFVIAGIVCALAALCYAEFASTVPVAGSAYTFSYASLGELIAWIIGWDLILELALGASTV